MKPKSRHNKRFSPPSSFFQPRNILNSNSEIIADIIINKIISLTITQSANNDLSDQLGNFCYEKIKEISNNILKIKYMHYDHYDNDYNTHEDNANIPSDDIIEPIKPNYDRCAYTLIKCSYKEERKDKSKITLKDNKSSSLNLPTFINISQQNSINATQFKLSGQLNNNNDNEDKTSNNSMKKRKMRSDPIELVSHNIAIDNNIRQYEPNNIDELRKERIMFDNAIKESQLNIIKAKAKAKENIAQENNKKPKFEFNFEKYTIDSKGLVIPYNKYISRLNLKNEFVIPRITWKSIRDYQDDNEKEEKSKEEEELKKDLIIAKQGNDNASQLSNTSSQRISKQFFLKSTPLMNPNIKSVIGIGVVLAGSNFHIINPETGVIIKNEYNTQKVGNMDFFKKYNRISINDYEKRLNESQSIFKSKDSSLNNNTNLNNSNSNSNSSNLLIDSTKREGGVSFQSRNLGYNSISNSSNLLSSSVKNIRNPFGLVRYRKMNHSLSTSTIKLNIADSNGLRRTLESFDSFPELSSTRETDLRMNKTRDLYLKNKMGFMLNSSNVNRKNNEPSSLYEMNKFTSSLLAKTKKDWGIPSKLINASLDHTLFLPKKPFKFTYFRNNKFKRISIKPQLNNTFLNNTIDITQTKTK